MKIDKCDNSENIEQRVLNTLMTYLTYFQQNAEKKLQLCLILHQQ